MHRTILPLTLALFTGGIAQAQTQPPAPPAEQRAPVLDALERVAGSPRSSLFKRSPRGLLRERLRLQWPDLIVERFRLPDAKAAAHYAEVMRVAVERKGPRFWGATVLLEQRGAAIVRLRGSRLKVDAAQTLRIRAAVWTDVSERASAVAQRHVFVTNTSGSRFYHSMEKRTPRRAGSFQRRLQRALFKTVYVPLAKTQHDVAIQAPNSVTSLFEQGEETLVARRTIYPEATLERRRQAPQAAIPRLQVLEDGLGMPLIRTPAQVRANQPPVRPGKGLEEKVAPPPAEPPR